MGALSVTPPRLIFLRYLRTTFEYGLLFLIGFAGFVAVTARG